jgi:hypothetical protein
MMSAQCPASRLPVFALQPIRSAALTVADCSAASGVMPIWLTYTSSSWAFNPCGYTAASVPSCLQDHTHGDIEAVRGEVSRLFGLTQWFIGLMFTIALGVLGLALNNLRRPAVFKEEKKP